MKPIPFESNVLSPRNVRAPVGLGIVFSTTIPELCAEAGIQCRVTVAHWPAVVLHSGTQHLRVPQSGTSYVGIGKIRGGQRVVALRALEILAHGFHDYAARECVCRPGIFCAPKRRGRPMIGIRAMSARERMKKMRAKRRLDAPVGAL